MTFDEFVSQNPTIHKERPPTLDEFRGMKGYRRPLDEHGGLRYPNGISKTERARIQTRLDGWQAEYIASEKEYDELKSKDALPVFFLEFRAERIPESEQTAAVYRSMWKRSELKRLTETDHG